MTAHFYRTLALQKKMKIYRVLKGFPAFQRDIPVSQQ